jgi:hypothetical protein
MKGKKELRNVDLRVKMPPFEYAKVEKEWRESIYIDRSEYLRIVLRKKPIVKKYRDQSLDDILELLLGIKNQLEGLGRSLLPVQRNSRPAAPNFAGCN